MRRVQAGQRGCNLFLRDFEVCNGYRNGLAAAQHVACPVDFVLGAKDQMTAPRQAAELATALAGAGHDGRCGTCADGRGTRCGARGAARGTRPAPARRDPGRAARSRLRQHLERTQRAIISCKVRSPKPTRCQNARSDGVGLISSSAISGSACVCAGSQSST